jgi:hypothetical protein
VAEADIAKAGEGPGAEEAEVVADGEGEHRASGREHRNGCAS